MTDSPYLPAGDEMTTFSQAYQRRLPVMLTGPTGCGKTRFVEHMGNLLGRPVVTISCHDDLTSSDLVGRFVVAGRQVWRISHAETNSRCTCARTRGSSSIRRIRRDRREPKTSGSGSTRTGPSPR
nr:AAA family ATPase [Mycolicibacterium mucogenicum]